MDPKDKRLTCPHCGCTDFAHSRSQLNTALATFFGLDAFNRSADVYACRRCGRLEWFIPPDEAYLVATAPRVAGLPTVECPQCNMIVKKDVAVCTCGWKR